MPPAGGERSAVRKNQYNLHIRLDEDERAALPTDGKEADADDVEEEEAGDDFDTDDDVFDFDDVPSFEDISLDDLDDK